MLLQIQDILRQLKPFRRIVVGVSGGADSVCLALALKELGYEIIVAHLNHGLRGQASDEDAAFVKKFASKLRVPCIIEQANISHQGNLEANARRIRYAFLENVRRRMRADVIAVGHQQDDQIETILMHLVRGAGLRGLAGMPFLKGRLIRPLLAITKREILQYLREHHQPFCQDQTNQNTRFLRNRLRHLVIPKFKNEDPFFVEDLLQASYRAGAELKKLVQMAKNWIWANVEKGRFSRENFQVLLPELKGEILIQMLGTRDLYSKNIHTLIRFIETGKTGKRMPCKGKIFTIEYDRVRAEEAVKKSLPKKQVTSKGVRWGQWLIAKKGPGLLRVRSWQPGDRFQPEGMPGSKKLQDFFTDSKIPRSERLRIPIVVDKKGRIVCVGNGRWSEAGKKWKKRVKIKALP